MTCCLKRKLYLLIKNGKNSSLTRRHFQLAETTLERWINQFNHSGING
ncbi:helix-turn-helix domain-containing protein, partial [Haemophilus influenzae]